MCKIFFLKGKKRGSVLLSRCVFAKKKEIKLGFKAQYRH